MRARLFIAAALLLLSAAPSGAQDPLKPDQLKKAYDDALVQLKSAQDRKAELAKENEALGAKVEELKKQLSASQAQVDSYKHESAEYDDRTFFLRSFYAAWQGFIRHNPQVLIQWKTYLGDSVLSVPETAPDIINPQWPEPMAG